MPFSLRLDPGTEKRIRRISTTTGQSKASVVREAIALYAAECDTVPASGDSAYDRLRNVIGVVGTGGAELATGTHAKYRASLRRKHRGRSR